ncbi:MAG: membrane protein insertase YidC [Betaproteobacteria bacterium]|nr:membrane protein insertase YidC [Betaproteobacteria bacterium]
MDNQRLILLLVFSFSLIMLWEAWQKQGQPKPPISATQGVSTPAANPVPSPAPTAIPAATGLLPEKSVQSSAQSKPPTEVIKTDLFTAEISSQGGDLVRLELVKHLATEDKTKKFILFDNGEKHFYQAQSGLIGDNLPSHKSSYQFVQGVRELKDGQDKLEVRLEATTGSGAKVAKTYVFQRSSYLIEISHEIVNQGATPLSAHVYFQSVRDSKPPEGSSGGAMGVSTFTGPAVFTEQDKYQKVSFEEIAKGKAKHAQKADNGWIAMVQHYFVSAWMPQGNVEREFFTRKLGDDLYAAGLILPLSAIPPGNSGKVAVQLYAGPQEQDKLAKLAPGLDLVVDYGWLTVIAAPLFWVLEMLYKLVGNWGWAIIALTVLLKLIFFPLSAASYKSMAKMKLVTPKLTKLKETYGDDRARLNQEMMELYKREKINPLGGCLPILIQIPVFIALYWVLLGTAEMRYAPWLGWIQDLSSQDPYYVLPLLMGATMLVQTKLNPTPPDPIQAKVMLYMPIVFTGMFLFMPAGLVLYWTVNNVLSIAQQWQITRLIEGGNKA